jgi:glyceraldehyde 3-phosphate dehydrogenase
MLSLAINGFGRIGRLSSRIILTKYQKTLKIVAINTSGSMDIAGWTHLLKYDTAYGKFELDITSEQTKPALQATDAAPVIGYLMVKNHPTSAKIPILAQRDPEKLPWTTFKPHTVLECTGAFTSEEGAQKHITAGAKKVIISAPVKQDNIPTYVLGVNKITGKPQIVSNASCTTNCASPVAQVIISAFGVKKAALTTIHSYTDGQNLQDNSHRKDLRRARAAAANIIPTSTGAAQATIQTLPQLKGIFEGLALRVPIITGSLADFTFITKKSTTVEAVNQAFTKAALGRLKGILEVTNQPLVSSDIIGTEASAIVDLSLTQVIDKDLAKVFAWYDNEWAYCHRLVEQAIQLGKTR